MATLLFPSLPPKLFVGINLTTFTSSPTFQGITNIPPGLHFLYSGTDASLSIRHGRWLLITDPRVYKLHWNASLEHLDLRDSEDVHDQAQDYISHQQRKARALIDYAALINAPNEAQDVSKPDPNSWSTLTSHITARCLTRILGASLTLTSLSSAAQDSDAEHIPGLSSEQATAVLNARDDSELG
ncbi:hypothetical protein LTR66_016081, partial [Elasticomyces elasticus]